MKTITGVNRILMPTLFGTALACLPVASSGATITILRSSEVPEFKLLFLVGGGLIVLASLVRRLYLGSIPASTSIQVVVMLAPQEIAEHLSARKGMNPPNRRR